MSKIEWTDHTWNPVRGCTRVSEGCRHCYAEGIAARFSQGDRVDEFVAVATGELAGISPVRGTQPFHGFALMTESGPRWTGKVELVEHKLTEPLRKRSWRGKRIFVNSMSDLFHENLPDEAIDQVFAIMALCTEVTFQVLTKRPERMLAWFGPGRRTEFLERLYTLAFDCETVRGMPSNATSGRITAARYGQAKMDDIPWPLPNVWLGVSVEDQQTADERIPYLLKTPAAVRFVSYEPALGPVKFRQKWVDYLQGWTVEPEHDPNCDGSCERCPVPVQVRTNKLDWIIAGGESGPGARPANPDWFRSARDQCAAAGVPFFMKQITERGKRVPFDQWPEELQVREFPG